jgi:hypothetical protein
LIACLLLLALAALPAGWLLFTQPDGNGIGLPLEWLDQSPFADYAIPGFILFSLFGVGALATVYGLIARPRWTWTEALTRLVDAHWSLVAAMLIGLAQMIWIVVQLVMTQRFFFLQPICFGVGLAIFALAMTPTLRQSYRLSDRRERVQPEGAAAHP